MAFAAVSVAAAGVYVGCVDGGPPSGFGVNVTVVTTGVKDQLARAELHVTGDETFDREIPDAANVAQSGEIRFRYVPGVQSGTLHFAVEAFDAENKKVARGASGVVVLEPGRAVEAHITLAQGVGLPCSVSADCPSGNCADGVCCDSPCTGLCEQCNLPGKEGQCEPVPEGQDPVNECPATFVLPDGDADDGGAPPSIVEPDGGAKLNIAACTGTCSGQRTCKYPDAQTACGESFCVDKATIAAFQCNGSGGCGQTFPTCALYACQGGACRTSCVSNDDCVGDHFCNVNLNQCVPRRPNGTTCTQGFECVSGFCVDNFCCNSACGSPFKCNDPGKEGQCQCPGVDCPEGVGCRLYYRDADGDGFGNANGQVDEGTAKAGCDGSPPTGFKADNSDCDDSDARVNKNQAGFFTEPSKGGTFDYNCNGIVQHETVHKAATCGFCPVTGSIPTPSFPVLLCEAKASKCEVADESSYFACKGFCLTGPKEGFVTDTAGGAAGCGQPATYRKCGTCLGAGQGPQFTDTPRSMGCH